MKTLILLFIIASTCLGLSHGINEVESKILANSVNKMSIDFFKVALNNEADNFVCSPFSVANVLAMSAFGSNSETRDEIIKVLHMKNYYKVIEKLHNKMSLNGSFDLIMNTDSLKIKNKMYVNENINIKSSFLNSIKNIFKSDVKSLDFNDSTNAANEINNWIEKETNNNIKDLVTNNDFDEDTALALINAVYFKGNWKYLFEINDTVSELFHVNKTFSKKIPTMKQTVRVNYNKLPDLDAKLVELPYEMPKEAGDMSMFIIVPNKIDGIKKIEENISKINLQTLLNTYKEKVEISLPKFKIETKINLKDYLKKMGINKAFTDEADFSGIADDKKLFISKILQKAFIEVNEEGTEAAAATNAIMQSRMLSGEFINANRPFIVILATRKVIVFIGRINDPNLI